jgi:hypothetical protein
MYAACTPQHFFDFNGRFDVKPPCGKIKAAKKRANPTWKAVILLQPAGHGWRCNSITTTAAVCHMKRTICSGSADPGSGMNKEEQWLMGDSAQHREGRVE